MRRFCVEFLKDEQGQEVVEYALLVGLIVVACIGLMGQLGVKVVARWESIAEGI